MRKNSNFIFIKNVGPTEVYDYYPTKEEEKYFTRLEKQAEDYIDSHNYLNAISESKDKNYVAIPNKLVSKFSKFQLYTNINNPEDGLILENLSDQDEEDIENYINAEKLGILNIDGDSVFLKDGIPLKISQNSSNSKFSFLEVTYLDPKTHEEIFSDEIYYLNNDLKFFKIKVTDITPYQIESLMQYL